MLQNNDNRTQAKTHIGQKITPKYIYFYLALLPLERPEFQ